MNTDDELKIVTVGHDAVDLLLTTMRSDGTRQQIAVEMKHGNLRVTSPDADHRVTMADLERYLPAIERHLRRDIVHKEPKSLRKRKPCETLNRMTLLVDMVPVPGLRKKLRKFVADEEHDILELYKANRIGPARWREWCAWIYGVVYVLAYPIAALVVVLIKKMYTGG